MRTAGIIPVIAAVLALAAQAAFAQSEDEKILEQKQSPGVESEPHKEGDPPPVEAPDEKSDEELDEQVFYSGMGVQRVKPDYPNLGGATNLALVLGFRVPTAPWFGLEVDLDQTLGPGAYRDPKPAQPAGPPGCGLPLAPPCTTPAVPAEDGAFDQDGREFQMSAVGLSLALKSPGHFYVTGKYGWRYLATTNDTINEDRSGKGFAAGVGYRWGRGLSGVELGYTQLADKVDAIGLTFFVRTSRN